MKRCVCFILFSICFHTLASAQQAILPEIEYESSFNAEDLPFIVGTRMLLVQDCTDKAAQELTNHVVRLNHYRIGGVDFKALIHFNDSLITKRSLYYSGSNQERALKALKIKKKDFQRLDKKVSYFTTKTENTLIHCWLSRKQLMCTEIYISGAK